MSLSHRAFRGALGGLGGTVVLTGFRKVLAAFDMVGTTAPEQVVERLEELGVVEEWPPEARRVLTVLAHLAYGVGTGMALGLLRRRRGGVTEETAVGSALGVLALGSGVGQLAAAHRSPPAPMEAARSEGAFADRRSRRLRRCLGTLVQGHEAGSGLRALCPGMSR